MDIQHLVDRLEQILSESRRVPMTTTLLVDEDQVFNIIDQLRVTIPDEVKPAVPREFRIDWQAILD